MHIAEMMSGADILASMAGGGGVSVCKAKQRSNSVQYLFCFVAISTPSSHPESPQNQATRRHP